MLIINCLSAYPVLASTGKGLWIWRIWECENGDLSKVLNRLKSAGVNWVIIKCGDSDGYWLDPGDYLYNWASQYGGFSEVIKQFHNSGIKVFGWHFVYSSDQYGIPNVSELDVSNMILDISGIDGLVINAESAYEGQGKGTIAEQYMKGIRQKHPTSFIAYSSFARVTGHEWFPWLEFGKYSNRNMPQAYWAARPLTPEEELQRMKNDFDYWHSVWKQGGYSDSVKPIVPVGQGGKLEIGREIYNGEIKRFCDTVQGYGYEGVSLYAYHIMNQASWDEYGACWTKDNPPTVNAFDVQPRSVTLGNSFTISYTVSDDIGLKETELWRTNNYPNWPQPPNPIQTTTLSGQTNYSGSFYDTPTSTGTYYYGLHVVDTKGQWNDEQNSQTGNSPEDFGPIQVTVTSPQNHNPTLSNPSVDPLSGDTNTNFYYYVQYYDQDGDSPEKKWLIIDGGTPQATVYVMQLFSGSSANGIYKSNPITLSAGNHKYHFEFTDGKGGSARLPSNADQYLIGPNVIESSTPDINLPSNSLSFGDVVIGTSKDLNLTIQNIGNAPLNITNLTRISGSSEFSVISYPSSISANSSDSATIRFSPGSTGAKNATFRINSNDPDESTVDFTASGNGITPPPNQYTLNVNCNPTNGGWVSLNPAGGVYNQGQEVTLTANPYSGYQFDFWSGDVSGNTNPIKITMNSNKNITANFKQITQISTVYVSTIGDDITGDGSQAKPYRTIQKGINVCSIGGTVFVSAGTYNEAIYINKNIALIGAGANICTITAQGISNTNTVTFNGSNANGTITGFRITGAPGGYYGIFCTNASPTVIDNTILGNNCGICCYKSSSAITNNTISGNDTGVYCHSSSPTITNNTISENGDGIHCYDYSSPSITNNTISGNDNIGIICEYFSSASIINNTISGNRYYGIVCQNNSPAITNNIITKNGTTSNTAYGIYCNFSSPTVIEYNDVWNNGITGIQNYSGCSAGPNDISFNPQFIEGGNFHLGTLSPCIDAGSNTYVPAWLTTDKDGNPRKVRIVDMGAYEFQGTQTLPPATFTLTLLLPAPTTINATFTLSVLLYDNYGNIATTSGIATLTDTTNSISPSTITIISGSGTTIATIKSSPNGGTDTIIAKYGTITGFNTIWVYMNTQQGTITYGTITGPMIEFGSGSLGTANVIVSVSTSTTAPTPPSGIAFAGIVYDIEVRDEQDNPFGTQSLPGSVTIRFPYQESNGFVAGTNIREENLLIYHYEDGIWTPLVTYHNYIENYCFAYVPHFSPFAIGGTPTFAPTNNDAFAYPNPWRKNDAKMGGRYISFGNVRQGSVIRIYSIAGELIDEIEVTDCTQKWDVLNKNLASGIYIYTVTGGGGGRKVGKFGIIK
ncbi:MAG: right-handed parallel beta-helix repeat-containing protein [bacterium]